MHLPATTVRTDLDPADAAWAVAGAAASAARFAADVADLDDDAIHLPSSLDGWSRAMVCAHVAHVGSAMHRLTRDVLAGRTGTAMYPDGRHERQATINHGRVLSADELRRRLDDAEAQLTALWTSLDTPAWGRTRRDPELGPMLLSRMVVLRWTELEVHRTDLGLAGADTTWSDAFVAAALPLRVAWLGPHQRRSSGVDGTWTLAATDLDRAWEVLASGPDVRVHEIEAADGPDVRGRAAGVLAFLLGRPGPKVEQSTAAAALKEAFPGP